MLIFTLIICLTLVLSALARRHGVSRLVAFGLLTFPPLVVFIYFAMRHDIELGPHGGIVPAWIVAGIVLLIVAVISFITARVIKGAQSHDQNDVAHPLD